MSVFVLGVHGDGEISSERERKDRCTVEKKGREKERER